MDDLVNEELAAFISEIRKLAIVANRFAWTLEQPTLTKEDRKEIAHWDELTEPTEAKRVCMEPSPRGNWCEATEGHEGDHWFGISETWPDVYVEEGAPAVAEAPKATVDPAAINKVTINWAALRLVMSSRLSRLISEGKYHPRNKEDRGYGWVGSAVGVSANTVRVFLTEPHRITTPEIFVRFALWTGHPIMEFIDTGDDDE